MYVPIIGLEVHVQLKTRSKMFCSCRADYFNMPPNSLTCPVCLGLPGALPVPNEKAIEKVIKMGLATNCKINKLSKFDRKNYFYPDLPKGYQISQFDQPISENGYIELANKRIRIKRIHLEEDTAKTIYSKDGNQIDFNKSGVPLMELVTEPDFETIEEVNEFAKKIKQLLQYCNVSDADMEKGQVRYELNISLKDADVNGLPNYKVEIKNIGSISLLNKAINYEIKRQTEILKSGINPVQETRGLDDKSGKTVSQRTKEESHDYRYFPEPDIPPLIIDEQTISRIQKTIPQLPDELISILVNDFGIPVERARVITSTRERGKKFFELIKNRKKEYIQEVAKWYTGEILYIARKNGIRLEESIRDEEDFEYVMSLLLDSKISGQQVKTLLERHISKGENMKQAIEGEKLLQISDESELMGIIETVISENKDVVKDIEKNPNAIGFLVGQVMKKTRGKANPKQTDKLLRIRLLN